MWHECSLPCPYPNVEMLFVVHVGDHCNFMILGSVLLIVDQRVHVVVLQKLLAAALSSEIVILTMWVKNKRNGHILVGLVLLPLVKSKLQGDGIRDDFADVVQLLES